MYRQYVSFSYAVALTSKRSAFRFPSEFKKKLTYELRDIYRALDVLGSECDLIQSEVLKGENRMNKPQEKTLYLSLGENCLTDGILKRHGMKSFTTPYSHGRSNIEYALQIEQDHFSHFLDPKYLVHEMVHGKPVVRLKYYMDIVNQYAPTQANGFEFTHHDVLNNQAHREALERRAKRLDSITEKVIFFYHHRHYKDTNPAMLLKHLAAYRSLYAKRCQSADCVLFTQRIVGDVAQRRLTYAFVNGIHVFTFYTLQVWEGNDHDVFWAKCDDDLVGEMLELVKKRFP